MTIEKTEDEIIIRIPADINIDDIQEMIDIISYRQIISKSKATQEQIDELASEAKKKHVGKFQKRKKFCMKI